MSNRPIRVGEQIREVLTDLVAREVHDPGIGFITLTRVDLTADLQLARVYYTTMGDEKARRESSRALERARPFLRRHLGRRLRLRHVPDLQFFFDDSIERHDRIERILQQLQAERDASTGGETAAVTHDDSRHDRDDER
ncbi:MAG TPA: 30S ribosome-binding factor RbfA [Vicinamibacterales bacterium]|jgi:ribosome-binding factor A